jgi:acyl phosphate:glycerol-3-phosphate acyltransferase
MNDTLLSALFILVAYLSGSLAFAVWVTRWRAGVDVRQVGSRHATATNALRQAGWKIALFVALLDVLKGFLPVYLARSAGVPDLGLALVGAAAVAGHCWPIFAGFRGGMGLAPTGGALLAVSPIGFAFGLGWVILVLLIIRHAARAMLIATLSGPWVALLLGVRGPVIPLAMLAGLIVASRYASDWRRKYKELWLDREKAS